MSERILSSVPPFLDGVYLGTNAIPDAYLVIDCPSGCFGKCERIALNHDLGSTLFDPMGKHRIVQSGINFAELTMGSERALGQLLHSVVEKTQPKALIMTQATSALLTSNDLEALCLRYGAELELPIVYLPPQTLEGDYVDGYEAFLEALVEALLPPASEPRAALEGVSLVGFLVHRLEEDQRADLEELRRLVEALQLPLRGILLDGSPMETLAEALKAEALIELPHAGQAARRIAERTGARVLEAALPMGVGGTIRWLETLGRALDREDAARRLIRAELEPLLPTLERVRDRFLEGRRLAISAEPALAAGLFAVADELGLQVPLILAQTRHEERLGCVREAIAASRQRPLLLLDRGPLELETALRAFEEGRGAELLIGASPDRDTAANLGLEFLEVGFPSFLQHALFAKPLLGFAGMRRLADELVNAVQRLDYARNRARASAESA